MQRRDLWVWLGVLVLSGCTMVGQLDPKYLLEGKRMENVRRITETFASDVRWGRFEAAASQVEPELRQEFLATVRSEQAPIRFTDFQVLSVQLGPEQDQASALVSFQLFRPPSMSEETFTDEQTWRYEPRSRRWIVRPSLSNYSGATRAQ